jgi:HTH-type transcriptional regulator, sugar sensing transcriptional regulator
MKQELLHSLGMSKNEAKVYLAILSLGSTPIGRISKDSGVHRRSAYDIAENLVRKGLVGYVTRGKVKHFQVASLEKLLEIAKEKKEQAEMNEKELGSVVKQHTIASKSNNDVQEVSILSGRESRKIVFEDILRTGRENCCLGGHTPSKLSINYVKQWHRRRVKAGINDRIIYCKNDPFVDYLGRLKHTKVRITPKPIDSKTVFNIYDNKVAIFLWANDQPLTIWINNKKVSDDFKEYFNFIWSKSKSC